MTTTAKRFPSRYIGATLKPWVVNVKNPDTTAKNLTNDTALFTMRLDVEGSSPIFSDLDHTNTPGTAGQFLLQPLAANVNVAAGEYLITVIMTIDNETEPASYLQRFDDPF